MTDEAFPARTDPDASLTVEAEQVLDSKQQLLPHQLEIEAAITRILEDKPGGCKVHLKQMLWESLGVERMPSEDFGLFLSTFFAIPGVRTIDGKKNFVWLEGKPEPKVHAPPVRDEKPTKKAPEPLTSEAVVIAGSFEELLKGWRKEARNLPNDRKPKNRRRVHFKRVANLDEYAPEDIFDSED